MRQKHAEFVEGKATRPVWLKWTSQKRERVNGKVRELAAGRLGGVRPDCT